MSKGFNLTAELNLRGPSNIRTVVADIRRQVGSVSVNITPTVNRQSIRNIASTIRTQLSNITSDVKIRANTASLRSIGADIRRQLGGVTANVNVRANQSSIRAVASDIRRQLGSINTNVNVRFNTAAVTTYGNNLRALNNNLNQITASATNATAAINALTAAMRGASTAAASINNASVNVGNLGRAAGGARNSIALASNEMIEFGRQSGLAFRRFSAITTVTGIVYGLTNAIRQGVASFIDFDLQMTRIAQVTGDAKNELGAVANTITNLSTTLGASSAELTKTTVTLAQAGLTAKDTATALRALALSALAPSFDDMNQTVEGSIALMRQFGIGANQLEMALGSVNAVSAKFAVEASDIITAIQRTGGVFASASKGVSSGTDALNEFIAVFTSIRATTRESAETIATGLRTIFTRIQRGETIESLKEFGVTLTDLEGKFVGPYVAVQRLSEGLSRLDPRDLKFSQIVEELGGFRQIGKVLPLIQQFATAQDALSVAQQGQGSLAADAAKGQLALAVQIQKVREEFLALIRSIGETSSFQNMVKVGLDLASALIKVADATKGIIPLLTMFAAFKGISTATQYISGFSRGIRGGEARRAHEGGPIRYFASGGYVPGFGNGDTVSAKLTPGEFVMSRPAVQSIGVGRLHSLNRSRGGSVQRFDIGGVAERYQKETTDRGVKKRKSSRAAWNPEPIEPPNPPKTLPLGGKTNFTHLHTSIEQNRIPKSIKKVANKEGINLTRLYSNMGLDLPENWNKNWNLKKQDRWGASTESLQDYISRKGAKVFETLLKTGQNVGNYRFHGRSESKAFEILKLNGKDIASSLASKLAGGRFFDTDPEVESILPTLLKNSVYEALAKKSGQAETLMKGFEEVTAYKAQGVKGRQSIGTNLRPSTIRSKIVSNILNESSAGYKRNSAGGSIQKFMAGDLVEPSAITSTKKASTSEIIKLLGLETAAKAGGISSTDVYTILNKRTPTPQQAASKAAILAEFTKKQNRLSGAKQARTTRITSKGLLFGAAGMLGSAFAPINKKIASDQLKAPVDVRIVSGIMDPKVASATEQSFTSSLNKTAGMAAKKVMVADILAKAGLGRELNLDFDRTLAFGADKILSDPKTPKFAEFGDRNKVAAALRGAKLSLLGKELAGLVSTKPELLGNLKLITARPASTLDLVQGWLSSKGLPIPLSQFKGLGGPGVSGSQIAKLKAALLSPGSLFIDDDARNIKAAKARSKEGIIPYRYGNRKISSNPNAEATAQGTLFEKMIQKLGGPGALKGQGMDFPQGLKGAAKYFGIPGNIATDAKRTINGPSTVEDNIITYLKAKGYNLGGIVQKFAVGGSSQPKDTLEKYFTDAAPINLGLSNSKSLSKNDRKSLASDVRNLRQLRTPAPEEVYSSLSRNAFDKFAMDTGLNKTPEIPAGTKFFERSKFYAQEVASLIGKSFSLPGFVSTSKNYGVAKSFLDNAPRAQDNWAAMLTVKTKKNAQGIDVAEQLKDRKINVTKQDINSRTGKMETFFMKQPHEENEVMLSPRSRFRVNTAKYVDLMGRHNLWANVQQYVDGGAIQRFPNGGTPTVPALVSNGEAYIPPEQARNIGLDKLREMNQADRNGMRSFAGGGVSVFKGPGTGTSDSIGPVSLPVGSFIIRAAATKALGLSSGGSVGDVQGFAAGGAVQRFAFGGGPRAVPDISGMSDARALSVVGVTDNVTSQLENLATVLQELGVRSSNSARIIQSGTQATYQQAIQATQADIRRARLAGASAEQIAQAENQLADIRRQSQQDITTRRTLGRLSGTQLQQIDSGAQEERNRLRETRTTQLRSTGMSQQDINTQLASEAGDIDRAAYRRATRRQGINLGAAGLTGDDAQRFVRQSMGDPRILRQMDQQLRQQLRSSTEYTTASRAQQRQMRQSVEEEIRTRRDIVNNLAGQRGQQAPGGDQRGNFGGMLGLSFGLQGLGSLLAQQINSSGSASAAASSAGIQGGVTGLATGGMLVGGLQDMLGSRLSPAMSKLLGGFGIAATAAAAVGQAFIEARNATIEFEKNLQQKKLETVLTDSQQLFEKLNTNIKNVDIQRSLTAKLAEAGDAAKAGIEANNKLAKAFWVNLFDAFGSADQGAASQRSEILEKKGVMAYIRSTDLFGGGDRARSREYETLVPEKARENSKSFAETAKLTTDLIGAQIQSGSSVEDIFKDPAWAKQAEVIARSNAAVEQEILSIRNNANISNLEKEARIKNIISINAEEAVRQRASVVERQKQMKSLDDTTNVYTRSLERMFQNMEQSIGRASFSLEQMSKDIDLVSDSLQGQAKIGGIALTAINTLQNPRAYSDQAVSGARNVAAESFGIRSPEMISLLGVGEKIESTVMSTINKTVNKNPGITNEALGIVVGRDVKSALADLSLPADLVDKLSGEVGNILKDFQTSGEDKLDYTKLSEKLGQLNRVVDSSKRAQEVAIKALEFYQNALNTYAQNINKTIDLQISANQRLRKATDIVTDSELSLAKTLGKNISLENARATVNSRVAARTGGVTNPNDIFDSINKLENTRTVQQAEQRSAADRGVSGQADFIKFTKNLADTNVGLRENIDALKYLAENTDIAASAMEKIQEAQQKSSGRASFIEKLVTSTPEELDSLSGAFQRLQNNANGQINTINRSVGAQRAYYEALQNGASMMEAMKAAQGAFVNERKETLGALNDIIPFLGDGQQAGNVKANVLESMLQESGIGVSPLFQQILNTLRNPEMDPATQAAIAEYREGNNLQARANALLAQLDSNLARDIASQSAKALASAMSNVKLNFETTELSDIASNIQQINAKIPAGVVPAVPKASGGIIYAAAGRAIDFKSQGTDTVPAMLTPGEFVVNRAATQRNLPLLHSINSNKYSGGGPVKYYSSGGYVSQNFKSEYKKSSEDLKLSLKEYINPEEKISDPIQIYYGPKSFVRSQKGIDQNTLQGFGSKINKDGELYLGSAPAIDFDKANNVFSYKNGIPNIEYQFSKIGSTAPSWDKNKKKIRQYEWVSYQDHVNKIKAKYDNIITDIPDVAYKAPEASLSDTSYDPNVKSTKPVGLIFSDKTLTPYFADTSSINNLNAIKIFGEMSTASRAASAAGGAAGGAGLGALIGAGIGTVVGGVAGAAGGALGFGVGAIPGLAAGAAAGAALGTKAGAVVGGTAGAYFGYTEAQQVGLLPTKNSRISTQNSITELRMLKDGIGYLNMSNISAKETLDTGFGTWKTDETEIKTLLKSQEDNKKLLEDSIDFVKGANFDPTKFGPEDAGLSNLRQKLEMLYSGAEAILLTGSELNFFDPKALHPDHSEAVTLLHVLSNKYRPILQKSLNTKEQADKIHTAFPKLMVGGAGLKNLDRPIDSWATNYEFGIYDVADMGKMKTFPWVANADPSVISQDIQAAIDNQAEQLKTKYGISTKPVSDFGSYKLKLPDPIGDIDLPYHMQYTEYTGPQIATDPSKADSNGFNLAANLNKVLLMTPNNKNPFSPYSQFKKYDYSTAYVNKKLTGDEIFDKAHVQLDQIPDFATLVKGNIDRNQRDQLKENLKSVQYSIDLDSLTDHANHPILKNIPLFTDSPTEKKTHVFSIGEYLSTVADKVFADKDAAAKKAVGEIDDKGQLAGDVIKDNDLPRAVKDLAKLSLGVFGRRRVPGLPGNWLYNSIRGVLQRPFRDSGVAKQAAGYTSNVFGNFGGYLSKLAPMTRNANVYQQLKELFTLGSGAAMAFAGLASGDTRMIGQFTKLNLNAEDLFRTLGGASLFGRISSAQLSGDYQAILGQQLEGAKIKTVGANGTLSPVSADKAMPQKYSDLVNVAFNPYNEFPSKDTRKGIIEKLTMDMINARDQMGLPYFDSNTQRFLYGNMSSLYNWYGGNGVWEGQDYFFDKNADPDNAKRTQQVIDSLRGQAGQDAYSKGNIAHNTLGFASRYGSLPTDKWFVQRREAGLNAEAEAVTNPNATQDALRFATGGVVYAQNGQHINFQPRGTDTVPAMLTPGEFVINRAATQRNLPLLHAINNGGAKAYSDGGAVYLARGGLTVKEHFKPLNTNIFDGLDIDKNSILEDNEIPKTSILKYIADYRTGADNKLSKKELEEYNTDYGSHINNYMSVDAQKKYNSMNPQKQKLTGSVELNNGDKISQIQFIQTYEAANKIGQQKSKWGARNTLEENFYSGDPNYPFSQATYDLEAHNNKLRLGVGPFNSKAFGYGAAQQIIPALLSLVGGGVGFALTAPFTPVAQVGGTVGGAIIGDQLGQFINQMILNGFPSSWKKDINETIEKYPESYEIGQWTGFAADIAMGGFADDFITKSASGLVKKKLTRQAIDETIKSGSSLNKLIQVGNDTVPIEKTVDDLAESTGKEAASNSKKVDKSRNKKSEKAENKAKIDSLLKNIKIIGDEYNSKVADAYNKGILRKYDETAKTDVSVTLDNLSSIRKQAADYNYEDLIKDPKLTQDELLIDLIERVDNAPLYVIARSEAKTKLSALGIDSVEDFTKLDANKMFDEYFNKEYDILSKNPLNEAAARQKQSILDDITQKYDIDPSDFGRLKDKLDDIAVRPRRPRFKTIYGLTKTAIMIARMLKDRKIEQKKARPYDMPEAQTIPAVPDKAESVASPTDEPKTAEPNNIPPKPQVVKPKDVRDLPKYWDELSYKEYLDTVIKSGKAPEIPDKKLFTTSAIYTKGKRTTALDSRDTTGIVGGNRVVLPKDPKEKAKLDSQINNIGQQLYTSSEVAYNAYSRLVAGKKQNVPLNNVLKGNLIDNYRQSIESMHELMSITNLDKFGTLNFELNKPLPGQSSNKKLGDIIDTLKAVRKGYKNDIVPNLVNEDAEPQEGETPDDANKRVQRSVVIDDSILDLFGRKFSPIVETRPDAVPDKDGKFSGREVSDTARENDKFPFRTRITGNKGIESQYKSAFSYYRRILGEYNYHKSIGKSDRYAQGHKTTSRVARTLASGGVVYASTGALIPYQPRGTDTVPAMLTPGEFVVNRAATQRNLPLLKSINSNTYLAKGGSVGQTVINIPANTIKNNLDTINTNAIKNYNISKHIKEQNSLMIRGAEQTHRETLNIGNDVGEMRDQSTSTYIETQQMIGKAREIMERYQQLPNNLSTGGIVYAADGTLINYQPRGTDTVPAMLTPGEFVVNAQATRANLPLLQSINQSKGGSIKGFANGGVIYATDGGTIPTKPDGSADTNFDARKAKRTEYLQRQIEKEEKSEFIDKLGILYNDTTNKEKIADALKRQKDYRRKIDYYIRQFTTDKALDIKLKRFPRISEAAEMLVEQSQQPTVDPFAQPDYGPGPAIMVNGKRVQSKANGGVVYAQEGFDPSRPLNPMINRHGKGPTSTLPQQPITNFDSEKLAEEGKAFMYGAAKSVLPGLAGLGAGVLGLPTTGPGGFAIGLGAGAAVYQAQENYLNALAPQTNKDINKTMEDNWQASLLGSLLGGIGADKIGRNLLSSSMKNTSGIRMLPSGNGSSRPDMKSAGQEALEEFSLRSRPAASAPLDMPKTAKTVSLFHASNTGLENSILQSFQKQGGKSGIAGGYGQGKGLYAYTSREAAEKHARNILKGGTLTGADIRGKPMIVKFDEALDPSKFDLDYEFNAGYVTRWIHDNFDDIQKILADQKIPMLKGKGLDPVTGSKGIHTQVSTVQPGTLDALLQSRTGGVGPKKWIYDTQDSTRDGEILSRIIKALEKRNPEMVKKFRQGFFETMPAGSAIKYTGSDNLMPSNIDVLAKARGGMIYASRGTLVNYQPRGTDTVPAMLTPGEFVVNAKATSRNLSLLQSINNGVKGYSNGGVVDPIYRDPGGVVPSLGDLINTKYKDAKDEDLEPKKDDSKEIKREKYRVRMDRKKKNSPYQQMLVERRTAYEDPNSQTERVRERNEQNNPLLKIQRLVTEQYKQNPIKFAKEGYKSKSPQELAAEYEQLWSSEPPEKLYDIAKTKYFEDQKRYKGLKTVYSNSLNALALIRQRPAFGNTIIENSGKRLVELLNTVVQGSYAEGLALDQGWKILGQKYPEFLAENSPTNQRRAAGLYAGGLIYANTGMLIPYQPRGTDTVPAMLTPGEFVVNKQATQNNLDLLKQINSNRYNQGGAVAYKQSGGPIAAATKPIYRQYGGMTDETSTGGGGGVSNNGNVGLNLDGLSNFTATFDKFIQQLNGLKLPEVINIQGNHKVDVVINGAAAFQGMQEGVRNMVLMEVNKAMASISKQTDGAIS